MQRASGLRQDLSVLLVYNLFFCGSHFAAKWTWENCDRQSAEHTEEQGLLKTEVAVANRKGKNCDFEF